ncbi:isoamyl alcohol oxidase [Xylariomycetidae sp. FL0641]|nr:isoamyl alcohol oxidase [Xylariomycetidae sp. FL0641]
MRVSVSIIAALAAFDLAVAVSDGCRCFPGDDCWPGETAWSSFNATVGGRLIRTVPIGHVCHDPDYDEAACEAVKAEWVHTDIHIESSHSVMTPFAANASCDPMAPRELPCVIGTYVQYSVAVNSAEDISKTIQFANEKNIRLVIRNTGHDYLGKSTGAGALAIWTRNLKDVEKLEWSDAEYEGPAVKMGAGMLASEVAGFTDQEGLVVVSGNCPSVGLAGGFLQGGGHGPLGNRFGMAADNALEFEVVDGTGKLVTANRDEHSDLFWALRGGGAGTYGVVVSATVKAFPDMPVSFGTLMFAAAGLAKDVYYGACEAFYEILPALVDAGCVPIFLFTPDAFMLQELIGPDVTPEQMEELLKPFLTKLDKDEIQYMKEITHYEKYRDFQKEALAPMLKNQANFIMGSSWLISRTVVTTQAKEYFETVRNIVNKGAIVQQLGFNFEKKAQSDIDNAVLPGWRDTLIHAVVAVPYSYAASVEENKEVFAALKDQYVMKLAALSPETGAYGNEASPFHENWKRDYYGIHYDRLNAIKDKYDPDHTFYAVAAVGNDYWVEKPDKRICKAKPSAPVKDEL